MASWELLSTDRHRDLRVRPDSAAGRNFVQVVPSEFERMAARCPILLTKHPETGRFYCGALFGFAANENLLIDRDGAFDGAMPIDLQREGFFVTDDDIAIDRDLDRFRGGEGALLFDDDGNATDRLVRVQRALTLLKAGLAETDAFVAALLDLRLVEPIDLTLSFDDGERIVVEGLYTLSRDTLAELDDEDVVRLFRHGWLHLVHVMIASLGQIPLLARRRNDRILLG